MALNLDPIQILRRRERFNSAVQEEVYLLRRRHGEAAARVAREKLARPDLTSRYRKVLENAMKRLEVSG